MAKRAKRTVAIDITTLKGLKQVRISMGSKPLVAILGVNGAGKSSILHALACAYAPRGSGTGEYIFPRFFPKTHWGVWNTTKFLVTSELFSADGFKQEPVTFWKDVDQWKPAYDTRPERDVYFIGIGSAVPKIELELGESFEFDSEVDLGKDQKLILDDMKAIFNREYSGYWILKSKANRNVYALQFGQTKYDAFSMGAGEQRVLHLLAILLAAPQYSLILIDEVDLLLHARAFDALIDVIHKLATREKKELQIVFTTHREAIISKSDKVELRHIHPGFGPLDKTLYFEHATSDIIERLTGTQPKDLEIFVEDDFAEAIVYKVASELGLSRFISIGRYGAAINGFSLAAGYALASRNLDDLMIVLDGDVNATDTNRKTLMNAAITGTDPQSIKKNSKALGCIKQFHLTSETNPEQFIHGCMRRLSDSNNKSHQEVIQIARALNAVTNKHDFINKLVERLGGRDSSMALSSVIEVAAKTKEWKTLTQEVRKWIKARAKAKRLAPL